MRMTIMNVLLSLAFLFISGCGGISTNTDVKSLPEPTKNILLSNGGVNEPYVILGNVYCVISWRSAYNNAETNDHDFSEAIRKVAYAEYGDRVDAVINIHTTKGIDGGFFGAMGTAYGAPLATINGSGVAVHFKDDLVTHDNSRPIDDMREAGSGANDNDVMDKNDWQQLSNAFESGRSGQPVIWQNPNNSNSYKVIPQRAYYPQSSHPETPCRQANIIITIGDKTVTTNKTACRNNPGIWTEN